MRINISFCCQIHALLAFKVQISSVFFLIAADWLTCTFDLLIILLQSFQMSFLEHLRNRTIYVESSGLLLVT